MHSILFVHSFMSQALVALMLMTCLFQTAKGQEQKAESKDQVAMQQYASQIAAAKQAWNDGNLKELREKLKATKSELRGWEHHYLLAQAKREGKDSNSAKQVLEGSKSWIDHMAFTKEGRRLVVGANGREVPIWDIVKNKTTELVGHEGVIGAVAVSPDGKKIATGGWDGKVFVWDAKNGKKLLEYRGHNLPNHPPGDSQTTTLRSICFSPDSQQILSVAFGNSPFVTKIQCEVKVWSAETGKTAVTLEGKHTEGRQFSICHATFSPNGKLIATGGYDRQLRLWNAKTGKLIRIVAGHTNNVLGVAFSPDGKRIATASTDRTLGIWEVDSGKELFRLEGHRGPVFSVMFSPDGKRILSGCWDRTVRLWDAGTGVELFTMEKLPGPVRTVVFSPDGKRIAAGGGAPNRLVGATVWDSSAGEGKD